MTIEAGSPPARSGGEALTMTGQLAAAELRSGDVLAGRFRVESMLGIGGMGVVYRAYDLSLDVEVAIKLLRPELARRPESFERFRQELLLARQVSSPHVVRIHDIAQQDGRWFISMDFVDGQSLERRMDHDGRLGIDDAVPITRGLLEGLTAAHGRGVVHRDLKPANVLLDKTGHAYITDFGVARSLGATGGMTQSGVVFGTPEYLSPEQARGEKVDARSDLYTVGLILYEMLSGTLPFSGGTPAETVMQRIVRQPPSLAHARPDLPHWLCTFCDRLLKLNPAHRFASARDALQALDARRVPRRPLNRRTVLLALLALVAVAGAVDFVRRGALLQTAPHAVVEIRTPRVAVLPLTLQGDNKDLAALGVAFAEHLRAWLRGDPELAAIARRRTLAALARAAPDMQGDALLRQLPDVARTANATQLVYGRLQHAENDIVLELAVDQPGIPDATKALRVQGADAAALFAAYIAAAPAWLKSAGIAVGNPPPLAAPALAGFGHGLLAFDNDQSETAAQDLAPIAGDPPSALIALALLNAQESARQQLPAQATRESIMKALGSDPSPTAREAYARALAGSDQGDAAAAVLAEARRRFPHDEPLATLDAETRSDNGDDKHAIDTLKLLVKTDDQDAHAWFLLGRSAIKQGDARQAVDDYLVRALVLNMRAGNDAATAETNNAIGVGYERLGQLDAAAEQYTRAAAVREKLHDNEGLAKTLRNLAIVQAERGDRAAADQTLNRVKALLERLGDRASIADLYNDRGVVAEERGDFADALNDYRQALALRKQLDEPALVAESLNNVGYCSYQMGDFDNASVYWQQALAQAQKLDDQRVALQVSQNVALLDIALGHFGPARERLEKSLRASEDHQLPEETAVANLSLGDLALIEGRFADAITSADRAKQIFVRRADERGQNEAGIQQARIALATGDGVNADKALGSISLEKLSAEQRAAYLFATARRALLARNYAEAAAKLDTATAAASAAHSGSLGVNIQLERVRLALAGNNSALADKLLAALRKQTTQLGEIPLRLAWLELELASALHGTAGADALTHYREAAALLKTSGRYRDAVLIHELGERLPGASSAEAAAAHAAAETARAQLLAETPAAARESLQLLLRQRWEEEAGIDHGN
ncbi:MAG: protein kinase [Rudaea sp.]|nr:protein kinase [Rudaea sp.]